jgi:glycosyltransferase involved in cell wall biosynthesis
MINDSDFKEIIKDKKILFIATKNKDYLRIKQEITLLKKYAKNVDIIISLNKNYFIRLIYVYWHIICYFKNYDIVFIGFAPQLLFPFIRWKFRNKTIIIDFFISLYDTFVFDRKKFKNKTLFANFLFWLDKHTIKRSDYVVCDTIEHSKYFIEEFGAKEEKIYILYLNADSRYYYPVKVEKPEFLKNKFTVLYFGSVLPLQGLDIVIEAINQIKDEKIFFLLIGPLSNKMRNQITNKNIKLIEWISQEELAKYISYSDLCLAGHFASSIKKAKRTIPGKAYIYEAMNKKMVLGDNLANKERYSYHNDNVLFVPMGKADSLRNIILQEYRYTDE